MAAKRQFLQQKDVTNYDSINTVTRHQIQDQVYTTAFWKVL